MLAKLSDVAEEMRLREGPLQWLEDSTDTDTAALELGSSGSGLSYVVC
jgi:hypothetical protein